MKIKSIIILSAVSMLSVAAFAQKAELTGIMSYGTEKYVCLHVLPEGKTLQNISMTTFNMTNGQSTSKADYKDFGNGYYMFSIQASEEIPYAYRMTVTFTDSNPINTCVMEELGQERFDWLGSDVAWSTSGSGWAGHPAVSDKGMDNNRPFTVNGTGYYKGISTHAKGYFVFDFAEDSPYTRLFTKYGIQDNCVNGDIDFYFTVNGVEKERQVMYAKSNTSNNASGPYIREFECEINGATNIVLGGDVFDNNNSGDHMNYPMARVYYKSRNDQKLIWQEEKILNSEKPFAYTLDAVAESGGNIVYRIIAGADFATLDGNVLNITSIPEDKYDYIEVEAFQPGTEDYKSTDLYRCKYYVRNEKIVQRDEKLVLKGGSVVDELIVYGDAESIGQVIVDNGFASVRKLILKYTFKPGQWTFVSFPGNFNIDEVSNLNELGYYFNKPPKAYYIREYSTKARTDGTGSTWNMLSSPEVKVNKGYIMGVARTADNPNSDPVEVTFEFDNTVLGVSSTSDGSMNVQLDLTNVVEGDEIEVVVKPVDVKGIPLNMKVRFEPTEDVEKPLNFETALDESRITFNPNRSGIRLTLPDDTPAKVLIFNKRGKVVKAVEYVSPHLIDISDLKKGRYDVLVEYGNYRGFKEFEIE